MQTFFLGECDASLVWGNLRGLAGMLEKILYLFAGRQGDNLRLPANPIFGGIPAVPADFPCFGDALRGNCLTAAVGMSMIFSGLQARGGKAFPQGSRGRNAQQAVTECAFFFGQLGFKNWSSLVLGPFRMTLFPEVQRTEGF
jgi:hypothetical protein